MNISTTIDKNLIWIISTLVAIGVTIGTIKYQGQVINNNCSRITKIETTAPRLVYIESDIKEIKTDIKEIKGIILKPAFVYREDQNDKQTIVR